MPLIFATMYLAIVSTNLLAVVRAGRKVVLPVGPLLFIAQMKLAWRRRRYSAFLDTVFRTVSVQQERKLSKSLKYIPGKRYRTVDINYDKVATR